MSDDYFGIPDNDYRDSVPSATDLPSVGNNLGDMRFTQDTGIKYVWAGTTWVAQDSGSVATSVTVTNFPPTQPVSGSVSVSNFPSPSTTQDTVESGVVDTSYGDVTGVAMNSLTTLTSYVAGGPTRVKFIEVTGTNIATYTALVNGVTINKKNTFYGYLDNDFQFSKGFQLSLGDVVTVQVIHQQTSVGEFSGFILVLKDY